mmetsp:Transcript_125457/g.401800  ORF Transcript_125457/g.401800 Transcript_125457/m.401800 type:complete len:218 (+) Transcript_125457:453-1106(+)
MRCSGRRKRRATCSVWTHSSAMLTRLGPTKRKAFGMAPWRSRACRCGATSPGPPRRTPPSCGIRPRRREAVRPVHARIPRRPGWAPRLAPPPRSHGWPRGPMRGRIQMRPGWVRPIHFPARHLKPPTPWGGPPLRPPTPPLGWSHPVSPFGSRSRGGHHRATPWRHTVPQPTTTTTRTCRMCALLPWSLPGAGLGWRFCSLICAAICAATAVSSTAS